jgi:hypothetical protein
LLEIVVANYNVVKSIDPAAARNQIWIKSDCAIPLINYVFLDNEVVDADGFSWIGDAGTYA